jgi:thioredoxin 1
MANSNLILTADDSNFESNIGTASGLALVDFWAEWCGPCKALGPTIDELATDFQGKVKVYKMNVDENPNTPTRFNVRGIPTCILFKDGKVVDMLTGKYPKEAYVAMFEKHL